MCKDVVQYVFKLRCSYFIFKNYDVVNNKFSILKNVCNCVHYKTNCSQSLIVWSAESFTHIKDIQSVPTYLPSLPSRFT